MSDEVNKAPVYAEPEGIDYIIIKVKESVINGERGGSRYETTRKAWRAKLESAMPYQYVLSVVGGIVQEVYHVTRWYTSPTDASRIEFEGEVAEFNVRNLFVGKMIPECYRQKGLASPFLYKKKAGAPATTPAQEVSAAAQGAEALKAAALKVAEEAAIKAKAEAEASAKAAAALKAAEEAAKAKAEAEAKAKAEIEARAKAEMEAKAKAIAEAKAKANNATKCEDNGDGRLVLKQGQNKLFFKIVDQHAEVVSEYDGMWDEEPQGEITIPDAVTKGEGSFKVTIISRLAFANCTKITKVNLPGECSKVDEKAFFACTGLQSVDFKNVSTIGLSAFQGCTGLQSVDFKNVSTIGQSAFQECKGLQSIDFKNVSSIGSSAFKECKSLTKAIIPNGVTMIDGHTFYQCEKLEKAIIPNSVKKIGYNAFGYCSSLKKLIVPNKEAAVNSEAVWSHCTTIIR